MKHSSPALSLPRPTHVRAEVWQQHLAWFEVISETLRQNSAKRDCARRN